MQGTKWFAQWMGAFIINAVHMLCQVQAAADWACCLCVHNKAVGA
jgi:hypothetical protein